MSAPSTIDRNARERGCDRIRHHHTRSTRPFPPQDPQVFVAREENL